MVRLPFVVECCDPYPNSNKQDDKERDANADSCI